MEIVQQPDGSVVLRVVYDGPPEAGKTTSVKALAKGFGREVYTPEERNGRTVYFDWLEHTGGRFEGAPIRCQIVSVPGQDCWARRRAHMLEQADVVVFVGDTREAVWRTTLDRLKNLRALLDARDGPPVGIVFQANYRDAPDAIDTAVVRQHVDSARVALVESVALDGTGVREAFVFAVRLALDRLREEQRLGAIDRSSVHFVGVELLRQLRALETQAETVPSPAEQGPQGEPARVAASAARSARTSVHRLPSYEVPSGLVWPPVEGRIFLREAMSEPLATRVTPSGDHVGFNVGYRAHSAAEAVFDDLEEAREMLIAWARAHVSAQPLLSRGRCVVLAATDDGRFRLWQLIRSEPSLRHLFVDGCEALIPRHVARQLATACRLMSQAQATCARHSISLACTLDTVGISDSSQPIYVGEMTLGAGTVERPHGLEQVIQELAAVLERRSPQERSVLCREFRQLQRRELMPATAAEVEELLGRLVQPGGQPKQVN